MHPARSGGQIFILGVGRCGSTFLQTILSSTTDVWIWGEHDGILEGLIGWGSRVKDSDRLNKFSFSRPGAPIHQGATTAWLNGFRPSDIDSLLHDAINQLMLRELPEGKTRWGFKEIRYDSRDQVAERLLEIFPTSKIIHLVRNPFQTIESSILSWNPRDVEAGQTSRMVWIKLAGRYKLHVTRWIRATEYFMGLEERFPDRVRTLQLESIRTALPALFDFLSIDATMLPGVDFNPINQGSKKYRSMPRFENFVVRQRRKNAKSLARVASMAGYDLRP